MSERLQITRVLPAVALLFALLSLAGAVAAIVTCSTWLLIPYDVVAILGVVCGVAAYHLRVRPPLRRAPQIQAVVAILLVLAGYAAAFLFTGTCQVRETAELLTASGQLCGLSCGMHAYYNEYGRFPPAAVRDANGKPLLSWRVTLLPFIQHRELHARFNLNEPWDSPHNHALLAEMPSIYAAPHRPDAPPGTTVYQVFVGPGTAFDPVAPLRLPPTDFPGGPRELLLVVEAAQPVPWTSPEDLPYAPDRPLPPLGSLRKYKGPLTQFVPNPVRYMLARNVAGLMQPADLDTIDEETLRRSIALDEEGG